jgi:hypothetical protein
MHTYARSQRVCIYGGLTVFIKIHACPFCGRSLCQSLPYKEWVTFKCHHTRDCEERSVYIYHSDFGFFSGLIPICHRITPQKPRPQNGGAIWFGISEIVWDFGNGLGFGISETVICWKVFRFWHIGLFELEL